MKPTINKKWRSDFKKFKVTLYVWESCELMASEAVASALKNEYSISKPKKDLDLECGEKYLETEEVEC